MKAGSGEREYRSDIGTADREYIATSVVGLWGKSHVVSHALEQFRDQLLETARMYLVHNRRVLRESGN
jgi:hypothetical protein